ncbi:hypothetical protein HID58_017952 [Brassica napus]|uniref:Autophagy-related protein 9 n=1 Tax=Brassica napus TaxID=3708 RepID=A0ABQ8D8J9_BRANA|nr:hypothetical protein HID58_017952 [Brassica napus]
MMSTWQKAPNVFNFFKWRRTEPSSSLTTGLLDNASHEIELSNYGGVIPSPGSESPSGLLNGESLTVQPITDLDLFFERLYSYYRYKGLWCIIVKWAVELLSLGFIICFSGFFLLYVDWRGLKDAKCGMDAVESWTKPCDLVKEAIHEHPLSPFTLTTAIIVGYLAIFSIYWLFCFLSSQRLCVVKDLSAHEIVMHLMRKENYLIGMVNKGLLSFPISHWIPGAGPLVKSAPDGTQHHHLLLAKTLEWTLNWCILQSMFNCNIRVRRDFVSNPTMLKKQLFAVGVAMLLLSSYLVIFMLVYLFLRHAEQEFNEVDHLFKYRINNSAEHASEYLNQFPSHIISIVAKFVSFVSRSFSAVVIIIAFLEESLLEDHYTGMMLLEEMASIFITPFLLMFVVPKRVDDILQFIRNFTVDIEGVGNVYSFNAFDSRTMGILNMVDRVAVMYLVSREALRGKWRNQRNHPYLLDWYYTCQPHNRTNHQPILITNQNSADDCWPPNLGVRGEDMKASTSGQLFSERILRHHHQPEGEENYGNHHDPLDGRRHWWGRDDRSHNGATLPATGIEEDLYWEENARRKLSRTTFMDDEDDDIEAVIDLHFDDVYSSRPHETSTSSTTLG